MNAEKEFGSPRTWLGPTLAGFSEPEDSSLIYHSLLDLLKVNRIPDRCWVHTQTWNQGCENIRCSHEPLIESDLTQRQKNREYQILPGRRPFLKFPQEQMSHFLGFIARFFLWPGRVKMSFQDNDVSNPNHETGRFLKRMFVSYSSLNTMPRVRVANPLIHGFMSF